MSDINSSVALQLLQTILAREKPDSTPEPWMTIDEGAQYAKVSPHTLRSWVAGGLPHGRAGSLLRVKASQIDAWLLAGKAGPRDIDSAADRVLASLR